MREKHRVFVAILLCGACAFPPGEPGPQGPAGPNGERGPTGASGQSFGAMDGTRIKTRILSTADGLMVSMGLYDTKRAEPCYIEKLNGLQRCLPPHVTASSNLILVYTNSSCSIPIIKIDDYYLKSECTTLGRVSYAMVDTATFSNGTYDGCTPLQTPRSGGMYKLMPTSKVGGYYTKNFDGSCTYSLTPSTVSFYSANGTQVSDNEFAEASIAP